MIPIPHIQRAGNPLLRRFLGRSAHEIGDANQRQMYQVEGFVRYRSGQISYEEMTQRGINLVPVSAYVTMPAGTMLAVNMEDGSNTHDSAPLGVNNPDMVAHMSPAGIANTGGGGMTGTTINARVIRVDNRVAIDPHGSYMWRLSPYHKVRDICDDYHGRIYQGRNVPQPLHFGCNCLLERVDGRPQQDGTDAYTAATTAAVSAGAGRNFANVLQSINEHRVWTHVEQFAERVNTVNRALDMAGTAAQWASYVMNPAGFLIDVVATRGIEMARARAEDYTRQQVSQMAMQQGLQDPLDPNSRAQRAQRLYDFTRQGVDPTALLTPRGVFDTLDELAGVADDAGLQDTYIQRLNENQLLQSTKGRVVLLDDAVQGATRIAMLLI